MSSIADVSFRAHELVTKAFIEFDPSDIVVQRKQKQDDGAGGTFVVDPDKKEVPQHVRIVAQVQPRTIVTQDGRDAQVSAVVVGLSDFDVEEGDTFTDAKKGTFGVVGVSRIPTWRVEAQVEALA